MDEVFDLKQKNMWFRSRFVSILKRFLRAFMGDSLNRYVFGFFLITFEFFDNLNLFCFFINSRVATFVQHWTSAPKLAKEIARLK